MKLFISYRRSDTQDFSGRLAARLRAARGIAEVFLDVEDIAGGEEFERRIRTALAVCSVSLIVIGRDWCGENAGGEARIFAADDFVRLEVCEALKSHAKVLPVLANGAMMPPSDQLPEELRPLTRLNALSIRHTDFERDAENLLDAIFQRKKPGKLRAFLKSHPLLEAALQSVGGMITAFMLLVLVLAAFKAVTGLALNQVVGGPGPTLLVSALIVAAGAVLPFYMRRR